MSKLQHDAAAAKLRQQMSTYDKPWFRSCSELLRRNHLQGLKCLDLCCGNGEYSQLLRGEHKMDVTCADYIPHHLQQAVALGFPVMKVDLDAEADAVDEVAEAARDKFDLVVSLATIEHVFDSDNLLRLAHTVLKPNGMLIVNTPNISFFAYRLYSCLGGNRPFGAGHHIRFWDYRFLRTNLFLNGFNIVEDARKFYSLPQDAMLRALRNRQRVAGVLSWLFHACKVLQHLPWCRGLFTDELTVMAQKENLAPIGFALSNVSESLERFKGQSEEQQIIARLQRARGNGWLDEHLYLSKMVDELK